MPDVITQTRVAIGSADASHSPAPVTKVETGEPITGDRRRPGRIENASPELIALMRRPTTEAIKQIALYDAPNFVLPDAATEGTKINLRAMMHLGTAFGVCTTGWVVAFKLMMMTWG